MIREFHDEITRLRAELEKYGGGNLLSQGEGSAVMNEDGEMVVEKVVHVDNTEKMKAMEKQLEKEKRQIQKKFEAEK